MMANLSPIAVAGTKRSLNFSRDHTVDEGLDHIADLNGAMLQTEDVMTAVKAQMRKQKPVFPSLYGDRPAVAKSKL